MGEKEKKVIGQILVDLPDNQRLFRINAGMGWAGEIVSKSNSRITLKNPRPFHGAPNGWPDLAGWTTVTITEDMIGEELAIFTGVEVKATGSQSHNQKLFEAILKQMGGIYKVDRGRD